MDVGVVRDGLENARNKWEGLLRPDAKLMCVRVAAYA